MPANLIICVPLGPPGKDAVWTSDNLIKGERGPPGLKGDIGRDGPMGPPGPKGVIGLTGDRGFNGESGEKVWKHLLSSRHVSSLVVRAVQLS